MIGRVIVPIRPGDRVPKDCRIVRAFTENVFYDKTCLVIEAAWLPECPAGETWLAMLPDMDAVWLMRRKALYPEETTTLEALGR